MASITYDSQNLDSCYMNSTKQVKRHADKTGGGTVIDEQNRMYIGSAPKKLMTPSEMGHNQLQTSFLKIEHGRSAACLYKRSV